jgi:hypothetical protein
VAMSSVRKLFEKDFCHAEAFLAIAEQTEDFSNIFLT